MIESKADSLPLIQVNAPSLNFFNFTARTCGNMAGMLILKEPVVAIESINYLAVLLDANGTRHYWLPDGKYDGYDKECESTRVLAVQEELDL